MASLINHYLQRYCGRVGHSGPVPPASLPTLARLHSAQLTHIPFENLSLKLDAAARQHGIDIGLPAVYKKLVVSRRGGCVGAGTGGVVGACLASHPPRNKRHRNLLN